MRNRIVLVVLGIVCVLFFSSCCGMIDRRKELQNCDFWTKDIKIENVGKTDIELSIDIKIYNPNKIDVVLDKLEADILVDNEVIGKLTHTDKVTIETKKSKVVRIKANLKILETYKTIKKLLGKDALSYQLKGKGYFHTIFGDISFPFETTERIVDRDK